MRADWEGRADALAAEALAEGDATGWFERLYRAGADGEIAMPWGRRAPHWVLEGWASGVRGEGRRAVVVGAGLGADAAFLAGLGFATTAFDVSPTAVAAARERFPDAGVEFAVADLLDLPPAWAGAFDVVVEVFTLQALPAELRARARACIARLVAPGGTLLVVSAIRDDGAPPPDGPPWPLARAELDAFADEGLTPVDVAPLPDPEHPDERRWRAVFSAPVMRVSR